MTKIVIRTEVWSDKDGIIVKAVARNSDGTFVGATNQVTAVRLDKRVTMELIGK